ncbi:MAG: hypothetical protein ACYST9_04195, partial [Planctomycetota bacterium]
QWGDKWIFGENAEPVIFMDRENHQPIEKIKVFSSEGTQLKPRDIMVVAGPGASIEAKKRIEELNSMIEFND